MYYKFGFKCFLTMKEKIQQDLSKVGVKQEIIDETITFDRLYVNG